MKATDLQASIGCAQLEKLTDFFHACDRLRFTQCEMGKQEMAEMLSMAEEIVRLLEDTR